ncbi:MAG: hypothetical protein JSU79_06495 [Dehalococcoidales bacterium]|nr:MAG: hypothetical protein JSU79_06495 [Dehalococcoidales bacterium]
MEWLLFSYWLPPEPSRKRVFVWRQLKKLGALSAEGAWLLPKTDSLEEAVQEIVQTVEEMEGTANLYIVTHFNRDQEDRAIRKFRQEREKEYVELIAECHKAKKHIEWEYERQEFNFEEVEELEGDLEKINRWFDEISKRDYWDTELKSEVEKNIQEVEKKLTEFTEKTFDVTGGNADNNNSNPE